MSEAKLLECVPNFSEGRDARVIDAITAAIAKTSGITLLDVDPGAETNRTVVTFVGEPHAVASAAFAGIAKAAQLIDMRTHHGAHARQGATDVCPLVPISGVSVEECVEVARALGARVGEELGVPVYLYEAAATRPERRSLADLRAGEYEALEAKLARPEWAPDYGPARFNATAGATVIGVRPFLIAYNINLNCRSARLAKDLGLSIRERGRLKRDASGARIRGGDGQFERQPGLPNCRATGWYIPEYGRAQVTMNLTDFKTTNLHTVFDRVDELARAQGARVTGSEIVGLVPKAALLEAGGHYLKKQGMSTGVSERELIDNARLSLGLDDVAPFDMDQKVIEYRVGASGRLVSMDLRAFAEELASASPAPGGGSVSALGGGLAAALVAMVASLTFGKKGYAEHNDRMEAIAKDAHALKEQLLAAVDADTDAFNLVMSCLALPKKGERERERRSQALDAANKAATEVPLGVLERLPGLLELATEVALAGNQNSLSDAGVAGLMARAGARGAYYNVLINLGGGDDSRWHADVRERADKAVARVDELAVALEQVLSARLAAPSVAPR